MKEQMYDQLLAQLQALVEGEKDETGILANASALIKAATGHHWVGFYMVRKRVPVKPDYQFEELRLGPFQGPVACYSIGFGKGVCGTSWAHKSIIIVNDVEAFPGHIPCSALSRSEIVVPIFRGREVAGVLDIDSVDYDAFDETDKVRLEQVCKILSKALYG